MRARSKNCVFIGRAVRGPEFIRPLSDADNDERPLKKEQDCKNVNEEQIDLLKKN